MLAARWMRTMKNWMVQAGLVWMAMAWSGCAPSGPELISRADLLLKEGKTAEAIAVLERAVQKMPGEARAWNFLGLAYHDASMPDAARTAYTRALKLNRNLVVAHYNLGSLELEEGNYLDAERALRSFVTI